VPSTFFDDILTCRSRQIYGAGSDNRGGYCNPQLDALVAAAENTEVSDPIAALDDWRKADQLAADDAAIVPTTTGTATYVTSPRAKNFQDTPLDTVVLDQMWVK
jgi:ABC-type oligopeptide transport system substrate-binding subunit